MKEFFTFETICLFVYTIILTSIYTSSFTGAVVFTLLIYIWHVIWKSSNE